MMNSEDLQTAKYLTKENMKDSKMYRELESKCLMIYKNNKLSKDRLKNTKMKKMLFIMLKFSRILRK